MGFATLEHKYRYISPFERIVAETARLTSCGIIGMVIYWTVHYENGYLFSKTQQLDGTSNYGNLSTHVLCMILGCFFMTWSAITYRTLPFGHSMNKAIHSFFNTCVVVCYSVGLAAIVQWKDYQVFEKHFYSFHSWIGVGTISLCYLNYLGGATVFGLKLLPVASRISARPKHAAAGGAIFVSACIAAVTGLSQYQRVYQHAFDYESAEYLLQNSTGILLWLLAAMVAYVLWQVRPSLELLATSGKHVNGAVDSATYGTTGVVAGGQPGNGYDPHTSYGVSQTPAYAQQGTGYNDTQPLNTASSPYRGSYT